MESSCAEASLFTFLAELGIKIQTYRHAPVFTVEEAKSIRVGNRGLLSGGHAKSLFVRDKKKRRALVMVDENRRVDLKALASKIELARLSFGSADSLKSMLGVVPGSVTPFALINARAPKDTNAPLVVALDKNLMAHPLLFFHPLHNAATTAITPVDLCVFIKACGYIPLEIDFTNTALSI